MLPFPNTYQGWIIIQVAQKRVLLITSGNVVGFAFAEYPLIHRQPGWSEHAAYLYW